MKNCLFLLITSFILASSCNNASLERADNECNRQIPEKDIVVNNEELKRILTTKIDTSLLSGAWSRNENENGFLIRGDSMYFVEGDPCNIKISQDTLITHYGLDFYTYNKILKLDKDSLVLFNEVGDTIRLVRIN